MCVEWVEGLETNGEHHTLHGTCSVGIAALRSSRRITQFYCPNLSEPILAPGNERTEITELRVTATLLAKYQGGISLSFANRLRPHIFLESRCRKDENEVD
jgi:hypothetical protein